jgi:hypothetical protein
LGAATITASGGAYDNAQATLSATAISFGNLRVGGAANVCVARLYHRTPD